MLSTVLTHSCIFAQLYTFTTSTMLMLHSCLGYYVHMLVQLCQLNVLVYSVASICDYW